MPRMYRIKAISKNSGPLANRWYYTGKDSVEEDTWDTKGFAIIVDKCQADEILSSRNKASCNSEWKKIAEEVIDE